MLPRFYRPTVVGSVLAWFLVGLHLPALRDPTHVRHEHPGLLVITALLACVAVAGLVTLLRVPARGG